MLMREGVEVSEKAGPDDIVTAADFALSSLLCLGLAERFPDDKIVSEEDRDHYFDPSQNRRVWLIDPIDGTQNYMLDDGQYCVMVGLLVDGEPTFGFVYGPTTGKLYFGGPGYGAYGRNALADSSQIKYGPFTALTSPAKARLLMGSRDRKAHPWVCDLANVSLVKTGSIGLKVGLILDGRADVFAHLSRKLKVWDTAGPAAIALGAGLDVGSLEKGTRNKEGLNFPLPQVLHDSTVIMGRPGALDWCRANLLQNTLNGTENN